MTLYEILQETTKVFRKGEPIHVTVDRRKKLKVVEIFQYPHTLEAEVGNKYEKIDMIFVDIVVDKKIAETRKKEILEILNNYPQPERLAGGPSYIELAPNLGLEQEGALRLMALGKTLGLWRIVSGKTFGMDEKEARELAGRGLLMISGYSGDKNESQCR